MSFDYLLLISLLGISLILSIIWLLFHWEWLPIILLVILWYIPRQAAPNGLLEDYLFIRWLTVIVIPLLLGFEIFRIAKRKNCIMPPTGILIPMIILFIIYIVSGIINNSKAVEIIGSLILYLRYPLLFFIFINMELPEDKLKLFLRTFFFLLVIQIPESFYRFYVLGISGDYLSWTLGPWGHFDLGVYSIYAISLIIAYNAIYKFRLYSIIFILTLFAIAIMGEIKTFIISIPIVSALILMYYFRNSKGLRRIFIFSLPCLLIMIVYFVFQIWGNVHISSGNTLQFYFQLMSKVITNPGMLFNPQGLDFETSRFLGSAFVWSYLQNNLLNLLLGVGPGSLLAGTFTGTPGKIFNIPQYLNQIAVVIGEIGVLGLITFLWLFINVFREIIRPQIENQNLLLKTLALASVGMWIFYVFLGPFYDLVWRHDSPNLIFWFLIAFLQREQIEKEKNE